MGWSIHRPMSDEAGSAATLRATTTRDGARPGPNSIHAADRCARRSISALVRPCASRHAPVHHVSSRCCGDPLSIFQRSLHVALRRPETMKTSHVVTIYSSRDNNVTNKFVTTWLFSEEYRIDCSFLLRDDGLPPSRRLPALRQIAAWLRRPLANLRLIVHYPFSSFLLSRVNGRATCL